MAKTTNKKRKPKELTVKGLKLLSVEITDRFLMAMRAVIFRRDVKNVKQFAFRLNCDAANISKLENANYTNRFATLEQCSMLCSEFYVDANWLLTGKGEMFGKATLEHRIEEMDKRLFKVEEVVFKRP